MRRKVLIVDDSETARLTIQKYMEAEFEIEEAENGLEAIYKLENVKDIDLMLLDVNMPEMDGMEVVEEVARRDDIKKVQTIMLTTETNIVMKDKVRVHSFVRCWIIKPVSQKLLFGAIKKIFKE